MQENYACILKLSILFAEDCYISYAFSFCCKKIKTVFTYLTNRSEGIISSTSLNDKHEAKEL